MTRLSGATHCSAAWWVRCSCPRLLGRTLDDSPIVWRQKWCYIISLNVVGRGGENTVVREGKGEEEGGGRGRDED